MDSYDEIPYHSAPFAETHPVNLAVIGRLFGLETPDPDACRVLELGCASGGNLIPMAWHLPGSRFEGVELSPAQAAEGGALVEALGLTNACIRQADILGLGPEVGAVDYLIVHGVYSWVPPAVQERILALCAECLSPSGIAYVSYNTLPGWRMRGMLRDILLYHTRAATSPEERLARARELLERIDPALEPLDALSARYLRQEVAYLRRAHPSYLYHEYLEELNEPLLVTDFVARAERHGLQYLADTNLASMFPASLGDSATALVEGLETQVEQEQYLDFVSSRNFRQTLLCRAERTLDRELDLDGLARFAAFSALESPRKVDLRATRPVPFRRAGGQAFEVHHPLTRAALLALERVFPDSVALEELHRSAEGQVAAAGLGRQATEHDHLAGELFSLYANGAIGLDTRPRTFPGAGGGLARPNGLARAQVARGLGHLATARHATLNLDPFASALVAHLDEASTQADLVERLAAAIESGRLALGAGGASQGPRLRAQVAGNVERLLALFARHGLLEARQGAVLLSPPGDT